MLNEYKGFTGSNYEEDDIERAKAGGSINFFPDKVKGSILQNIAKDPSSLESRRISDILTNPEMQKQEMTKLGDIHKKISDRNERMNIILNKAAQENPGIASDLENQRMDHYDEFLEAYPEYKTLQEEQQAENDYYMNSALGQKHMMDEITKSGSKAIRGHDFTEDQFKNIMDYLKSKGMTL